MKVKGILKGNIVILQDPICVDKEKEVIVDIPDDLVEIIDEARLEKMDFFELAEYIWKDRFVDKRTYKELAGEALSGKYRREL